MKIQCMPVFNYDQQPQEYVCPANQDILTKDENTPAGGKVARLDPKQGTERCNTGIYSRFRQAP